MKDKSVNNHPKQTADNHCPDKHSFSKAGGGTILTILTPKAIRRLVFLGSTGIFNPLRACIEACNGAGCKEKKGD